MLTSGKYAALKRSSGLVIAAASNFLAYSATAASVDCTHAASTWDRLVCQSATLSELDTRLGQLYAERRAALSAESAALLQKSEQSWLHYAATVCPVNETGGAPASVSAVCLEEKYAQRIRQLSMVAVRLGPYLFSRTDLYAAEPAPDRESGIEAGFYVQHVAYPSIDAPLSPATQAWNKHAEHVLHTTDDCGQGDDSTDYIIGYANASVISVQWTSSTFCHGTPHGMFGVKSDNIVLTPALQQLTSANVFCRSLQCSDRLRALFASALRASGWSPRGSDAKAFREKVVDYMLKPSSWLFTREGLTVAFTEGVGGCYACNPRTISVSWAEMRPLLDPRSPLP